jgi:hypothetical protein
MLFPDAGSSTTTKNTGAVILQIPSSLCLTSHCVELQIQAKKKQPHDSHQVNSKKTRQFSLYHYVRETPLYFPPILHYMQHILILTDAISGACRNCLPFRSTWVHPGFSGVRVTRSLVLYLCFVDRCLSFCTFSFGHCVICSSSIYGFWLPLWYLQTLLDKNLQLLW